MSGLAASAVDFSFSCSHAYSRAAPTSMKTENARSAAKAAANFRPSVGRASGGRACMSVRCRACVAGDTLLGERPRMRLVGVT
eukprot:6715893-Prymnesium_polylepis.1